MARTEAGATLTETHRQGQLAIRAQALRDYAQLWPIWQGDEQSFQRLLLATYSLVQVYRSLSSSLAVGYYKSFRSAERVGGTPTPRIATAPDRDMVLGTLHLVGRDMTRDAIAGGQPPQKAMSSALVRTSGTVTRFTLDGGRETLIGSVAEDRHALGWARVVDADPCPFCRLLASRGAVYKEQTVGFQAHDQCGCGAQPFYSGDELPANRRFREEYDQAVREARAAGDLRRGTRNDLLNAYRRFLDRQTTVAPRE